MTKPPKIYQFPGTMQAAFDRRHRDDPRRALVLVMQRFAARICHVIDGAVVKGGLGLELRLDTPRTTKDADIIIAGSLHLDAKLKLAGELEFGDFLKFSIEPDRHTPEFLVPGMRYPAKRYTVQAFFADGRPPWTKPYRKFQLEIDIREQVGHEEIMSSLRGFPQAQEAPIRVYSLAWQIAEKVHAYTDPRHRETTNTGMMRPRDLLDLCRCAVAKTPEAKLQSETLRAALEQTFARRKAAFKEIELPDLPERLPAMPDAWRTQFEEQVAQAELPWTTPALAHALAAKLIDPVLNGTATGTWQVAKQAWE